MTTTQRKLTRSAKPPPETHFTVLVDTQDATEDAAGFVYAVIAALGLESVELADADDAPKAASIQVSGKTLFAGNRQWHYPDHRATFEHWLVSQCFPRTETSTAWAVVQTSADAYPMLSAAMAYAHADDGALLIDADASGALTDAILQATDHGIDVLDFDFDLPSPHIYLLNAPTWAQVTMMLQVNRANPLNSVLLVDTLHAAQHHFAHTVINCGADLFMAQRLAAEGVHVIHVDDFSRPLHVKFTPYKTLDYFSHRIPEYGTRRDFEFITTNRRRRKGMRRWMQRGDAT